MAENTIQLQHLRLISFTHQRLDLQDIGKLVICEHGLQGRLEKLREVFGISEIFYVATCNRVEFVFLHDAPLDQNFVQRFIGVLDLGLPAGYEDRFVDGVATYEKTDALNHLLRTSCSLESLVVGEKEILAQMRKAFDVCRQMGFTGDKLRLIVDCMVKTAKEVYTETNISRNPVSVVSLAYRRLKTLNVCQNSRILIIGAGETNQLLAKYLAKHKYANFYVYNRTKAKAEALAGELGGNGFALSELEKHTNGFDVLITCTGATEPIVTPGLYERLLNGETGRKVVLDLAVPQDVHDEVLHNFNLEYIGIDSLKEQARKNIEERYRELVHAEEIIARNIAEFNNILKVRRIELAMRDVPFKIKEIRDTAVNGVFADDIGKLDSDSKKVLEKVLAYMEKKYISVPMVMAKQILSEH